MSEDKANYKTVEKCGHCGVEIGELEHANATECIAVLRRQNDAFRKQYEAALTVTGNAMGELAEVREQNAVMTAEHQAMRKELAILRESVAAYDGMQEEANKLQDQLTEALEAMAQAEARLTDNSYTAMLNAEVAELRQQLTFALEANEKAEAERDKAGKQSAYWCDEAGAKAIEVERLQQQLAAAQAWEVAAREALESEAQWLSPLLASAPDTLTLRHERIIKVLSTPASEYAKRVRKLEAVAKAARGYVFGHSSITYGPLYDALDALKEPPVV